MTPGTRAPEELRGDRGSNRHLRPGRAWAAFGVTAGYEVPGGSGTAEGGELLEVL
ncbi:hypothetical protein [Streptomyces sp. NPDC003697]